MTFSSILVSLRSGTYLFSGPWNEVEVSPTSKDTTPEHKFGGVDHYTENIKGWLKDYSISDNPSNYAYSINSLTEINENTSPAASIPTKIKEIPRTVR